MKVLLGTSLFAPVEVYDTNVVSPGALAKFLKPYVYIEDNMGNILYTVGTPTTPSIVPVILGLAAAALLIMIIRR
ncbi:MAG: hypothetical protein JRN22_02225 [Nitrososphaerota archaeon]|nr:hypothetical protein [Nitrososphaerota archaeon]